MKRFITNDDLTVLVTKASTLRKLAKSAQKIHTDLAVEEGYVKAADKSIGRGHGLLQNRSLTTPMRMTASWSGLFAPTNTRLWRD